MKRIGLLSDTHGLWDDRYLRYFAACDEIWHAGDIGSPDICDRLEAVATCRMVWGNADDQAMRLRWPRDQRFELEGVAVWMTHIGGYPGRYAPGIASQLRLWAGATALGGPGPSARLFVCGHSHLLKAIYDHRLGHLVLNPGAAGRFGQHLQRTLMRFVVDAGTVRDLEVIELSDPSRLAPC